MFIKFSNLDLVQGSVQTALFINYIESLFFSISQMDEKDLSSSSDTSRPHNKEAKQLCKRIIFLMSLVSTPAEEEARRTKDVIALITSLAYSLKLVVRGALTRGLALVISAAYDT